MNSITIQQKKSFWQIRNSIQESLETLKNRLPDQERFQISRDIDTIKLGDWNIRRETILQSIFQTAISPIYSHHCIAPDAHITVTAHVKSDGLGDWQHAVRCAMNLIHSSTPLPNPSISIVCTVENLSERVSILRTSPVFSLGIPVVLLSETFGHSSDEEANEKATELVTRADLIIEVAKGTYLTNSRLPLPKSTPKLIVTEYGLTLGDEDTVLGFGPFQKGVLPPQIPEKKPLDHQELEQLLHERSHSPNYAFDFCYLKNRAKQLRFLALSCLASEPNAYIDVICPLAKLPSGEEADLPFIQNILPQLGVRFVSLIKKTKSGLITEEELELQEKGITLRVINPFLITSQDFLKLSSQARLVGCTGDESFSNSLTSLPIYEILPHKKKFFDGLLELLSTYNTMKKAHEFFSAVFNWNLHLNTIETIQALAGLCKNSDTRKQLHSFAQFAETYYCASRSVTHRVIEKITHKRFPELRKKEQETLEEFLKDKFTLAQTYEEIEQTLAKTFSSKFSRALSEQKES